MADNTAEQCHVLSAEGRKSIIVTIGKIPSEILCKYEGPRSPPLSARLRKRKSAPRKDGKPRRTKLGRPRKTSIQAEQEAEKVEHPAEAEAASRAKRMLPPSSSEPGRARSPRSCEPGFEKDFIMLSEHTVPLEMNMTFEGAMVHLQSNVQEKAQLEQQPTHVEGQTQRAIESKTQAAASQALAVQPSAYVTQMTPNDYGVPMISNSQLSLSNQVNGSRQVIQPAQTRGFDISKRPTNAFSSLPPNTRLDRVFEVYQTGVPSDAQARSARPSYFDTSTLGWHYDTTIRDNMLQNSLFSNHQNRGQLLDNSHFGLNLMRMKNANSIDPRLYIQGGFGQVQPSIPSSRVQHKTAVTPSPQVDSNGIAHIGFGTSTYPGVCINMTEVDATLAAPSKPDSSATLVGSPLPIPLQEPLIKFRQDRLLSSVRIAQRNMSNTRGGRAKFRKMVASHCRQEAYARDRSRGRYTEDNGTHGAYQVVRPNGDGGEVFKTLPNIGFRREKLDYVEGSHWKTAEEWAEFDAKQWARQVGKNSRAVSATPSGDVSVSELLRDSLNDPSNVGTADEGGGTNAGGTAFGKAMNALYLSNVNI